MADSLPLLKACMADVKNGTYFVSAQGLATAGATLVDSVDPTTGNTVKVVVDAGNQVALATPVA